MSNRQPQLDPWRFDAITSGPEKLWGLTSISAAIGVSVDKTRRLARLDHVPIYRPDGKSYFALRTELNAWLKGNR
jgi:aspartate aminotransferase-like enzyme